VIKIFSSGDKKGSLKLQEKIKNQSEKSKKITVMAY
jgi:hypothetical protein